MMIHQTPLALGAAALLLTASVAPAQMLHEMEATMGGMDQLNQAGVPSAPPFPGAAVQPAQFQSPQLPNAGAGFAPAAPLGYPGLQQPAGAAYPGLTQPGIGQYPQGAFAQPGQPAVATPTPIPNIKVLVGKRVYDAVTGQLLEDAIQLEVPQTDADKYEDDGIRDNGIPGDGIRGNVETIRDTFIGTETNSTKNRMINVVRRVEDLNPMEFYGLPAAVIDSRIADSELPGYLEAERRMDETLRDWNNRFLADFRVDKNDPRSDFYQIYVPEPPQPPRYPMPPGYIAPQNREGGAGQPGMTAAPTPNIWNGEPVIGGGYI